MTSPRSIKNSDRLWIEEGERRVGLVAGVALLLRFHKVYSYTVPDDLVAGVAPGKRVTVAVGKKGRLVEGFVVSLDHRTWDSTLRPIESVTDGESYLSRELIELGREICEHYHCPLGLTLKAMMPGAVRSGAGLKKVRYVRLSRPVDGIRASAESISKQRRGVLDALAATPDWRRLEELQSAAGASAAVVRAMRREGWIEIETRKEVPEEIDEGNRISDPDFVLSDAQQSAVAAIRESVASGRFVANLLFGVSGSGKTEVYVHAMREVIAHGKQAILLVPEIVLTTQLVQRLAIRFARVAVVHSGLTGVQRSLIWRAIAAGHKDVVIGTRSAVFAPCPDLGIICVDEEQETSYKNLQAPRFHVRDAAILRASKLQIPVVLGSATPSLETWYHSETRSDYRRLIIPHRVRDLPMPQVHVVNMEDEQAETKRRSPLSRVLERLLGETLEKKEQALLLINRRGFARQLYCPSCRTVSVCPHCNVPLVIHAATGAALCHYCRTREPIPTRCPDISCGAELERIGVGTQRVESILGERFPNARVCRVDSDTMTQRRQYERIVTRFAEREIDVLVGTQMIAKGLDFPFVSFVGMIDADAGAVASDFRSHERLFQLVTQVAGRAGRADAPGQVVVQTRTANLPAFTHALAHDYVAFATEELAARRRSHWPPFRRVARVVLAHPREETARREANALALRAEDAVTALNLGYADVLPATTCAISRMRGKYRYDVILRTHSASDLRKLLAHLETNGALVTRAQSLIIDVDPVSMT